MDSKATRSEGSIRCPKCGSTTSITWLEVEGDERRERVYFITCSRGDFDITVTDQQVVEAVSRIVLERLKFGAA